MEKTLGFRLRVERERLGVSQEVFAEWGGVKKLTQVQYENDRTAPDAKYLMAMAARGVDVPYVLGIGGSSAGVLAPRKRTLLENYEAADENGRRIIEGTADLAAQPKAVESTKRAA